VSAPAVERPRAALPKYADLLKIRNQFILELSNAGIRPWEFDLISIGDFVRLIERIARGGAAQNG
jgi:hypothetical protein